MSNRKKTEWEILRQSIMERHAKKFNILLDNMEGEEFALQYLKVLEYCAPKLARVEMEQKTEQDTVITIEHKIAKNEIDLEISKN